MRNYKEEIILIELVIVIKLIIVVVINGIEIMVEMGGKFILRKKIVIEIWVRYIRVREDRNRDRCRHKKEKEIIRNIFILKLLKNSFKIHLLNHIIIIIIIIEGNYQHLINN